MKIENVSALLKVKNRNYKVQNWHKNSKVFIFDYGGKKNQFFVLDANKKQCFEISKKDFLSFPSKHPNSIFVIEYAHLETRTKSFAQPLTIEEKKIFYKNIKENNVTLKYFPENKTPKARSFAYKLNANIGEKSEKVDCVSIYLYIKYFKNIFETLSTKDNRNTILAEEAKNFRKETNRILNSARYFEYKDDSIIEFIEKNKDILYERLSNRSKHFFGITKNKNGVKIERIKTSTYTILASLLDREGNKRIRERTRKPPGWAFVSNREFCLNSTRGGVSKSNLNIHFVPNCILREFKNNKTPLKKNIKDSKVIMNLSPKNYETYLKIRSEIKKSIKELFLLYKEILWNSKKFK